MTLTLNGKKEPHGNYQAFPGSSQEQMPLLHKAGYCVISVAEVVDRRLHAPEDVIGAWRNNSLRTASGSSRSKDGSALIFLRSPSLSSLTDQSPLYCGAMVLSDGQWEVEKGSSSFLHLTAEEAGKAEGGYVFKNGIWQPENDVVGDIWNFLTQYKYKNLKDYVKLVGEGKEEWRSIMRIYLNRTMKGESPTLRSSVLNRTDSNSNAGGNYSLYNNDGCLVGVAPEAQVAREISEPKGEARMSAYRSLVPIDEIVSPETAEPRPLLRRAYDWMTRK